MAECVSCGRSIPPGKFFCDDCYFRMKGRRRPSGEVPEISAEERDTGVGAGSPAAGGGRAAEAPLPPGISSVSKARGELTPAAGKKVISMKPPAEKAGREKAGKKRFTVTITFSERTYAALARIRRGGEGEGGGGRSEGTRTSRKTSRGPGRSGRPNLMAVAETAGGVNRRGRFRRAIACRERPLDRGDVASIAMAVAAVLMIVILSFQPWARITLLDEETMDTLAVEITGIDLGAITYACLALVAVALLYMVAAQLYGGMLSALDYGVVFIMAGVAFIPLFYAAIASNSRFLAVALAQLGRGGTVLPEQFERETLWPTYVMVIAGALLAFAGLLRLAERRGGAAVGAG